MLAYIDESGSLHPNAPELNSTLTAVCIPKNRVSPRYKDLCHRYEQNQTSIKI
ncbi:hypothetical protein GCM10028868_34350 [Virgibacillus kimchii]